VLRDFSEKMGMNRLLPWECYFGKMRPRYHVLGCADNDFSVAGAVGCVRDGFLQPGGLLFGRHPDLQGMKTP
jgi:hypothetical protein